MAKYPFIQFVLKTMANDQGSEVPNIEIFEKQTDGYFHICSERYDGPVKLPVIERALARLTKNECKELCLGDEDNWETLYRKCSRDKNVQAMVHAFIEEMFANMG